MLAKGLPRLNKTPITIKKKTRYRHTTAYNTEKDRQRSDDPHKHRSHVRVLPNVSEPPSQIFLSQIFLPPPFWKPCAKFFGRKKFATYGIH